MPPSITTYYEVLGISSQAQDQEIKEAYRSLALRMHPDKDPSNPKAKENFQKVFLTLSLVNSGQSPQDRPANQAMQQLIEAYETLSDTHRRQRYDLTLPQRQTRSAPSRSTVPQQGHRAHQGSKARASNQTSSYYWSQGYARAHPATGRKPSYDVNGEDWERAKYTLPPQDWYEKWTQTDNERQEREQQQREATAARIRKAEDEKQVMSWLLRQQMILKEVVRLSAEIIMAEAFKAGFPIGRQDVASAEDLDEDLEGHTIFRDDIKFNSLRKDLQMNLSEYAHICKGQRKKGYYDQALSAERDLQAASDKPRTGKTPKKANNPQAAPSVKLPPKGDRVPIWCSRKTTEAEEDSPKRGRTHNSRHKEAISPDTPATSPTDSPITPPLVDLTSTSDSATVSTELRALHLSHVDVHQDFWEIVEEDDRCCCMCERDGTLLQCPACEVQACQDCKSALGAPGGSFGPRAKANWF